MNFSRFFESSVLFVSFLFIPVSAETFTNPIGNGADPWVVRWNDDYYLCSSGGGGCNVSRAEKLQDIVKANKVRVWTPPPDSAYSKELWAPEMHYLRGKWYIYVAADDGDNFNHRMYVLEGTTQNPLDPFVLKAKITDATDRWAIDGTVLQTADDSLYFIWSGWVGTENVAQHLYIAPMRDPWTISGPRVRISSPNFAWEQRGGRPWINEGPQILKNSDDDIFIIYSASGSWSDDYCLGQLRLTGANPLDSTAWTKHPVAVFARTDTVFGPGHASFVKSPDGTEDWIVYHAARYRGAGWTRNIRIQTFGWNADGSPDFGEPVPEGVPLDEPSFMAISGLKPFRTPLRHSVTPDMGMSRQVTLQGRRLGGYTQTHPATGVVIEYAETPGERKIRRGIIRR